MDGIFGFAGWHGRRKRAQKTFSGLCSFTGQARIDEHRVKGLYGPSVMVQSEYSAVIVKESISRARRESCKVERVVFYSIFKKYLDGEEKEREEVVQVDRSRVLTRAVEKAVVSQTLGLHLRTRLELGLE